MSVFFIYLFTFVLSAHVPILPPTDTFTTSCPMVSTTTAQPVPPICVAMGAVWAQGQELPSPSSLHHPPPPPHALLVHGRVLPQFCCQTTPPTPRWVPSCSLHQKSPAGRFVLLLSTSLSPSLFTYIELNRLLLTFNEIVHF